MTRLKELYYSVKQSQIRYTRRVTHKRNMNRAIRNLPSWIVPSSRELKPKILVFADWTIKQWSPSKNERVDALLEQLIHEGFPVYIDTNKQLTPFEKKKFPTLRHNVQFSPKNAIEQRAINQLKCSKDELFILDDYWIDALLNENAPPSRSLKVSNFMSIKEKNHPKFIAEMKTCTPNLTHLIQDGFSTTAIALASKLKPLLPHLPMQSQYQNVQLSIEAWDALVNDQTYVLNGHELNTKHLEAIETLDLHNLRWKSGELEHILAYCLKLNKLIFKNCEITIQKVEQLSKNLNNLDSLEIIHHKNSNETLTLLLQAAKNIAQLYLGCELHGDTLTVPANSLRFLKLLTLDNDTLSNENLNVLLKAAPNLMTLELSLFREKNLHLNLEEGSLAKLTYMNLNGCTFSEKSLQTLLSATPALEWLLLTNNHPINREHLLLKEESLPQLTVLIIQESGLSQDHFEALLLASTRLKKLEISNWRSSENPAIPARVMAQLEQIELKHGTLTLDHLERLLFNAQKLQTIGLSFCSNIKGDLELNHNSLPALKKLDLSCSAVSAKTLHSLMMAAKNLETLNLFGVVNLSQALVLEVDSLPDLNELNLGRTPISTRNLKHFLDAAPNITNLNLFACAKLTEELFIAPGSLSELNNLNATGSSLSLTSLLALLRSTDKLKKICISGCTNLKGNIPFPEKTLLNLLELELSIDPDMQNDYLEYFFSKVTKLKALTLKQCDNISEQIFILPGSLVNLKNMILESEQLSTESLQTLLRATPKLKALDLTKCKKINGELQLPASSLLNLKTLSISANSFTLDQVIILLEAAPNLTLLDLSSSGINTMALAILKEKYPSLSIRLPNSHKIQAEQKSDKEREQKTETLPYPKHESKNQKNFKPHPKGSFKYKGQNKTKNQRMLIEQLSQYLTIKPLHVELIDLIQDGICKALSHYYLNKGAMELNKLLDNALKWNGKKDTIEVILETQFQELITYIKNYQLKQIKHNYLGGSLTSFLEQLDKPCSLSNPWHIISIEPLEKNRWIFYDSNHCNGPLSIEGLENLQNIITHALGELLSTNILTKLPPNIHNHQDFIQAGGLLILGDSLNANEILAQFPISSDFEPQALDGLLLRSSQGIPAWLIGLVSQNKDIALFSLALLKQFINKNPDYLEALQKSMEAMPRKERKKSQAYIRKIFPELKQDLPVLTKYSVSDYEERLQTWNKHATKQNDLHTYCKHCITTNGVKKRLIKLNSNQEINGLRFALEHEAKVEGRPLFYIDSPDDLVCNSPYIERKGDKGIIQSGEKGGGRLFDFLSKKADQDPILLINYHHFENDEIVRLHSILNKKPCIDKTELSDQTLIIGLLNTNKPDCYQGADFYGRFNKQKFCPVSSDQILKMQPILPMEGSRNPGNAINLFHTHDWKEHLLGRWIPDGDEFYFEEGALIAALKKKEPIEIQNGIWDETFKSFWEEAIFRGKIEYEGLVIDIPGNLVLIAYEGYEWSNLLTQKTLKPGANPPLTLNPACFNEFFPHLLFDKPSKLFKNSAGIIEEYAGKTLNIYLTRTLHEDEWAQFLTECKKHKVLFSLDTAPGVDLPEVFDHIQTAPLNRPDWKSKEHYPTQVIVSSDIDVTLALLEKDKTTQIIDSSECSIADLWERFEEQFNPKTLKFEYQHQICALLEGLSQGKRMILKGNFSQELADQLAPILLERQKQGTLNGELVLITDKQETFQYLTKDVFCHQVSMEEKRNCLKPKHEEHLKAYMNEPLCALQARQVFLETSESLSDLQHKISTQNPLMPPEENPNISDSDDAWRGFDNLPCKILPLDDFDPKTSAEEAKAFKENRRKAVNTMLLNTAYVFLAGLSGVGKSTFVTKEFCQDNDKLYQKDKILDWLEDKQPEQRKVLFIDEATLEAGDLSLYEGLFQDPPGILYQGKFYELTKEHSVIFAGNPVSYGDERKLAKLFSRHGNSLVFDPLPTAVLYEDILKPIFANTPLEPWQAELSEIFLKVYRKLVAYSSTEVLISPRELQMMAELSISYCKNNYLPRPHEAAEHFAFILTENLVPKEFQGEFVNQFKPKPLKREAQTLKNSEFLITPSRLSIYHHLKDILQLRKDRYRNVQEWNEAQLYGGLGGIILEGAPGIGKTELIIQALADSGYEEMKDLDKPAISLNPFYQLPVHLDEDKKTALLCKAFDEGAVVIIDEINSSPLMESLLNELLMGTLNGKRPTNPGFTLIASQNPTNMAGRRVQSTALSRRLSTFKLEDYLEDEMQDILLNKGVPEKELPLLLTAFKNNQNKARTNHWKPEPGFRDLINLAEELIKEMNPQPIIASIWNDKNSFFCKVNEINATETSAEVLPGFF